MTDERTRDSIKKARSALAKQDRIIELNREIDALGDGNQKLALAKAEERMALAEEVLRYVSGKVFEDIREELGYGDKSDEEWESFITGPSDMVGPDELKDVHE